MATYLIAQGNNPLDILNLNQYDNQFAEGDIEELRLNFIAGVVANLAGQVASALQSAGVTHFEKWFIEDNTLVLHFRVAQLPVWWFIGGVIAGIVAAFLISWVLNRITGVSVLQTNPILLIGVGALIYLALTSNST